MTALQRSRFSSITVLLVTTIGIGALVHSSVFAQAKRNQLHPGDRRIDTSKLESHYATYVMRGASGNPLFHRSLRRAKVDGRRGLFVNWQVEFSDRTSLDIIGLDERTLQTLRRVVSMGRAGLMVARFTKNQVTGSITPDSGPPNGASVNLPGPVFTGGMVELLYASLPLEVGFEATIPVFNNSRRSVDEAQISVTGVESVEVPGVGTLQAFVVEENRGGRRLKHWIADQAPYLVKREAGGTTMEVVEVLRFADESDS